MARDIVFLSGLEIETTIGIYEWERRIRQKLIFDLEMATDISRAAETDDISDTLDYKALSKRVKAFVGESSFNLVETLIEQVARIILDEFAVPWVRIRLNKKGAISGAADVGIVIERGVRDED
jgi:dihydroneopterin aldolase